MNCPFCNAEINDNTKFCKKCGARIQRCPSCGTVLKKKMRYCKKDGTLIPEDVLQIFDQYSTQEEASANSIRPTVGVLNFKKDTEKRIEPDKSERTEETEIQAYKKAKREIEVEEVAEITEKETEKDSGNKSLIGLLVFFIITFTASIAGLLVLLSGGFVSLF